jgi:hypothetical protein
MLHRPSEEAEGVREARRELSSLISSAQHIADEIATTLASQRKGNGAHG